MALKRFSISSGDTSSIRIEMSQQWPDGSLDQIAFPLFQFGGKQRFEKAQMHSRRNRPP